jgi:flagellar biosynthetic protein FliQ
VDSQTAVDLTREALMTALILGSPVLAVGLVVALVMAVLQGLTQMQDQTISFVPKLLAMVVALGCCLPWLVGRMVTYSEFLISNIPQTLVGG